MDARQKKRLIRLYVRRWQYLLGFESWEIRWTTGKPIATEGSPPPYGDAECFPDFDLKRAVIYFNLKRMNSLDKIERTAIHEILHCLSRDETKEMHQQIRRLEKTIRRVRLRSGGVF